MRIIAGKAKGKRLKTPGNDRGVRPLTDFARSALFNILAEKNVEARFLDIFAGTGAVGLEALSRGAKIAIFVELSRPAVKLIRENIELTGFHDRAEVFAVDAVRAIDILGGKGAQFDIIFLGAPYESPALEKAAKRLAELNVLAPKGVVIAEHRRQHKIDESFGKLKKFRDARYGETVLSFYENSNLSG
ncbi:MAG: 16S rRNA (guanine(966)-N(2))-methyltransferase RsmD [bacterium]